MRRNQAVPAVVDQYALRHRGIYFIFDRALRKGYVGAAYGLENIWQRWSRHAAVGGDARELKRSNPDDFVFSILQLVGQSTPKSLTHNVFPAIS